MKHVKNLLVGGFIFSVSLINSFQKPLNLGRYSEIIKAFSVEAKKFEAGFVVQNTDARIIGLRKEVLKEELKRKKITYATSWMPLLYKTLGAGLGLESIRQSILGGYFAVDKAIGTSPEVSSMILDYPIAALSYMNYPISYPIRKAKKFMQTSVLRITPDAYYGDWDAFFKSDYRFNIMSFIGISLAAGMLAKYFFNKAASYKNEITNIEKEIEVDDAMIEALSRN